MFYFDVLLKSENLSKAQIQEMMVEWGGEFYSQDPPRYIYHGTLIFDEFTDENYVKKYYGKLLGNEFDIDAYRAFSLSYDLYEIEKLINTDQCGLENSEFYKFLMTLSVLDDFVIVLIRDEEYIDVRYRIYTEDELIPAIVDCFQWESPKGAVIARLRK